MGCLPSSIVLLPGECQYILGRSYLTVNAMDAAVLKLHKGPSNGKLWNEDDWNDESEADQAGGYMYSKVSQQ